MKKTKILKFIFVPILMLILVFSYIFCSNKNKCIKLILLSPQTSSQMMAYVMVTSNNKVIVVDGGTEGDANNLIKYIEKYGNKVDYWFVTHHHNDHAAAINYIIKNTDIEIDNIYISLNDKKWYLENEPNRSEFSIELIDTIMNSRIKNNVIEPYVNQIINIDKDVTVKVLGIKNPEILENCGNNQSMIFKVYYNNQSILFLGDARN